MDRYYVGAWWYCCGYNDHRRNIDPYVDPDKFAEYVVREYERFMRQETSFLYSIQDSFKAFTEED